MAVVSCLAAPKPVTVTPPSAAAQPLKAPEPPAPQSPPASTGELNPELVARYVRSQVPQVKACYESALKTDPLLVGRIEVGWIIDVDGVPRDVAIASGTLQGTGIADCVRALIEGWRFAKPVGGSVEVSFPFVFQTGG